MDKDNFPNCNDSDECGHCQLYFEGICGIKEK